MGKMEFVEGQEVEVTDEEFKDSWYSAKVIGQVSCKVKKKKMILVEYERLMADEKGKGLTQCKDYVDIQLVRPRPPSLPSLLNHSFQQNQLVDAFHANGWWKGTITKLLGASACDVTMHSSVMQNMKLEFGFDKLRPHQDWIDGKWVIPQNQNQHQYQPQDMETKRYRGNVKYFDQKQLLQDSNTSSVDIANKSNSRKREREAKHSSSKSSIKLSLPSKKLNNGKEGSLSLTGHPETSPTRTTSELSTLNTRREEVHSQTKKNKCQILTDKSSSSSKRLSEHSAQILGEETVRRVLDCDKSGNNLIVVDFSMPPVSNIQGAQCDLSDTHEQRVQRKLDNQSPRDGIRSLGYDEIMQQKVCVGKETTTTLEGVLGQSKEMDSEASTEVSPGDHQTSQSNVSVTISESEKDMEAKCYQVDVGKSEQKHLLEIGNTLTIGIANESDAKERKTKQSTPKSSIRSSQPHKKLKRGKVTEDSVSLDTNPERTRTTETMSILSSEKESPQKKTDQCKKLVISVQSKQLGDYSIPSFGQETTIDSLDCDRSTNNSNAVDYSMSPLSNIQVEQCDSPITQVQCSQKNLDFQSLRCSIGSDEIMQQNECQKATSKIKTDECDISIPSKHLSDQSRLSFSQETTGNALDSDRPHPFNIQGEKCDLSKTQEQCSQKNVDNHSPRHSIRSLGGDEIMQQIECQKMASPAQINTDNISIPSKQISNILSFGQETTRSALPCDRSDNNSNVGNCSMTPLFNIQVEQCNSSNTQEQCLQENLDNQSPQHSTMSLVGDEIMQQKECVRKLTTTTTERMGRQSKEMDAAASTEGVSSDNQLTSQSNMSIPSREASMNGHELQKPLYMARCSTSLEENRNTEDQCDKDIVNGEHETLMQPLEIDQNNVEVTLENGNILFTKRHPCWKNVESMKVFHSMPQHPHFQPLQQLEESLREGHAIGYMLSFANLVEKTSKAQMDEPHSTFEKKLQALGMLETHGFNSQPIQARLEELLRVKDSKLLLDGMLRQFQGKIIKERREEESLQEEIDRIDKKLRELHESIVQMRKKQEKTEAEKQKKVSRVAALQKESSEVEEKIQGIEHDFECVAAAPW